MLSFVLNVAVSLILLYGLGALVLRTIRFPWPWALIAAPAVSTCAFCLLGESFYSLGIDANPWTMFFYPVVFLCLTVVGSDLLIKRVIELPSIPWRRFLLFMAVGAGFGYFVFVRALPSTGAIFQSEDIAKHALQIQAFVDSHTLSSLHSSIYQADLDIAPFKGVGFYPCAWHTLCALVCQITNGDVPTVMNATNFALSSLVYPLSSLGLLATLFENERLNWAAASISCVCISAFPWGLLVFGPLFPNLCALSFLPSIVWLFVKASFPSTLTFKARLSLFVAFLLASIGMALSHPNAIFSAAVILIPYCVYLASTRALFPKSRLLTPRLQSIATIVFCAAIWIALRHSPAFKGVTSFNWAAYCSKWQSLINVLTLSFTDGFSDVSFVAQPVVALALIAGCCQISRQKNTGWLPFSYAFACLICMVCMSTEGELKHLLGGFWYTDPFRLAATAGIAAVPLAALGLDSMIEWLSEKITVEVLQRKGIAPSLQAAHIAFAVLTFAIVIPSFAIPGICSVETAFTKIRLDVKAMYSMENPYSPKEREFVNKVKEVLPDDAVIINNPLDGSLLAYGFDDLHCYYRSRWGYGDDSEMPESAVIRNRLKDYASDSAVQDAVKTIGAEYVLLLDTKGSTDSFLQWYYNPSLFEGITEIDSTTPGFELVLADRNLRLYRIVA